MTTFLDRTFPVVALGAVLALAGACNNAGGDAGAAPAFVAPSADGGNTAEICKSSGEAARTVVVGLFGKMAEAAEGGETPDPAELKQIYSSTFGTLRDDLKAAAGKATDPQFAAALNGIAAEADKLATAPDPENANTKGFEGSLAKLEQFCPTDGGASAAPGGATTKGAVGAKDSGCELPVTFSIPAKWRATATESGEDDPLAELTRKGTLNMACEITAKPAGLTAFLRVWIDSRSSADARAALKGLLTGAKTRKADYRTVKLGGTDGTELTYELYSELTEEWSERRAFAVKTPDGAAVVELSGLEADDAAAQSAYDKAKETATVTS